jgi:hypothetical protein
MCMREADGMLRRRHELLIDVKRTSSLVLYTTFKQVVTSTGVSDKMKTCMRFKVFAGVKLHFVGF